MEEKRNFANIASTTGVAEQNLHHFMSNSPWSARAVIQQVQAEIAATPGLERGGVLVLDESANAKTGEKSAGSGRQYNGRLGKVDMSQVGTFLAYTNGSVWTWVDGELYLPKDWFTAEKAELREKLGIPAEREFKTKIELGWEMIQRAHANWAYQRLNLTDVVQNQSRVLSPDRPLKVSEVAHREDTNWRRVRVRSTERGELNDEFAAIWTIHEDKPVQEWLVIRRENFRIIMLYRNAKKISLINLC